MRAPSFRILKSEAAIYSATRVQDTTGGVQYLYASSPSSVLPCSAQPESVQEVVENDRLTMQRRWMLMFARETFAAIRDKIFWTDSAGVSHSGFVEATRDEAGRGMAYTILAIEKL